MRLIFANWLLGLDVEKLVPLEIKQFVPSDNKCKLKNTNSIFKYKYKFDYPRSLFRSTECKTKFGYLSNSY